MAARVGHKSLFCGTIVLILATVIVLILLGGLGRQILNESYYRTSKEESRKQAALIAELQSLSQLANKTADENAQEVLDQQAALKETFCDIAMKKEEWCERACRNETDQRILLILPIRDRWNLLKTLLKKLLRLLQETHACTFNIIVEQTSSMPFNKGLLMNAAVMEMAKRVPFDCIIFHDVDLVPVSGDEVFYECPSYPRHLSVKVDKFKYRSVFYTYKNSRHQIAKLVYIDGSKLFRFMNITTSLPYLNLIGGVLAMPLRHFLQTNGFSNMFWGWGAEDDDMFERLSILGIPLTRPMPNPTRYTMLPHRRSSTLDTWRTNVLLKMSLKRYRLDGLNSISYKVLNLSRKSACELFGEHPHDCHFPSSFLTHILVDPQPIKSEGIGSIQTAT